EGKETSDVDVLVEFVEPSFDSFMDLAFFLEDLFGRDVDLVTIGGLSPHIAPFVEREVVWAG
ncbi:MAG: nucleotidyltransferase domain-containing protein, partial [Methanothrix sp.]|nr:nucleotidyltransferase domain-containing protein [Methanothrix sp.]